MNRMMNRVFRWSMSRIPKMTDETLNELLAAANDVVDAVDAELVHRFQQNRKAALKAGPEPSPAWCGEDYPHASHMFTFGSTDAWCGGMHG